MRVDFLWHNFVPGTTFVVLSKLISYCSQDVDLMWSLERVAKVTTLFPFSVTHFSDCVTQSVVMGYPGK